MPDIITLVLIMAVVTYLPRLVPILLLSGRRLPAQAERWLSYVPVAALSALLAPVLFAPGGELDFSPAANPYFWVSLPVFAIAYFTRNLFSTVVSGMVLIAIFRAIS